MKYLRIIINAVFLLLVGDFAIYSAQLVPHSDLVLKQFFSGSISSESFEQKIQNQFLMPLYSDDKAYFFSFSKANQVFLAGDFNGWQPVAMEAFNGIHYLALDKKCVLSGAKLGYKFIIDGDYQADPYARYYNYDFYGELSLAGEPKDISYLRRQWMVPKESKLAPRWVQVYVPYGVASMPIMVMHDGQNLFDVKSAYGSWQVQKTVENSRVKALVVGIDNNGMARRSEYTHIADLNVTEPLADLYGKFIMEEVLPFITKTFKVNGFKGMMGSSLGGLVSLHLSQLYPEEFQFVGSMSGTLAWGRLDGNSPTLVEDYKRNIPAGVYYYLDWGGSDGDGLCDDIDGDGFPEDDLNQSDNYCINRVFEKWFAHELGPRGKFFWDVNAGHNEAAWRYRMPMAWRHFEKAWDEQQFNLEE